MTIKLEVGKAYRNRQDGIVLITEETPGLTMQFIASTGHSYTSSGHFAPSCISNPFDLVEEFTYFRTQQEIFKHLADGGYISNLEGESFLVGFNAEGSLCRYDVHGTQLEEDSWYFDDPTAWTIAVPKVPNWNNNIPEQGVLCWCKVYDDHAPQLRIIVRKQSCMPFKDIIGDNFNYAKPATAEELRGFLLESVFESLQERRNLAHNVFTEVSTNLTHKTGGNYK